MKNKRIVAFLWNSVEAVPVILPAVLAAFSAVVVFLLLLGKLENALVIILGLLAVVPTAWLLARALPISKRPGNIKERRTFDVLVIAGVLAWVGFNLMFTSYSVFVTRDPGIYATTGRWLVNHTQTDIHPEAVVKGVKHVISHSSGIWGDIAHKSVLQPQGMHIVPALFGLSGRVAGVKAVFKANIVIAGVALFAVYGFSRMILKPRWAALVTAIIASALPFLYFSRDTYTEPLATCMTFGGLTLLWLAMTQKTQKLSLWAIAGLTAGAGVLVRPDAYLNLVGIAIYFVVALALTAKTERKKIAIQSAVFWLFAVLAALLGWFDMTDLTSAYYHGHGIDVLIQLAMMTMVVVGGAIGIAICWKTSILQWLDKKTKNWRSLAIALAILVVGLGLMSRPLWLKTHGSTGQSAIGFTMSLQQKLGEPIEPRFYSEHTVEWVGWYIGSAVTALSFVGFAIVAAKALKDRSLVFLPALFVILLTMAIYLVNPRITPDQIWAVRRFVPVILPGMAIFGVYAIERMWDKFSGSLGTRWWRVAFGLILAGYLLMQPLLTSRPFIFKREKATYLGAMETMCQNLPSNAYVIWLGGSLTLDATQSTRAFCGTSAGAYDYAKTDAYLSQKLLSQKDLSKISMLARKAGKIPIIAIHGSQKTQFAPIQFKNMTVVTVYDQQEMEKTLLSPPQFMTNTQDSIELGQLQPDGSVSWL